MTSTHVHPRPATNRLIQYGAGVLMGLMVVLAAAELVLGVLRAPLLILAAPVTLAMILPVLMLTTATPEVTISAEGLTIQPTIWKTQQVAWRDVRAIKEYPLLPPAHSETGRKLVVGRQKYRPAQGKMLVIPSLPPQYRVTGWFAGEGFTAVIALTNRTHTDYERLIQQIEQHVANNF
jgi:hypothetical protein